MTSERRLRANRNNAKRSTGPKTAAGKARSARNARRHGLSVPISSDQQLAAAANDLARRIAGDQSSPHLAKSSRAIAEAELDVLRAQRFRLDLLRRAFPGRAPASLPTPPERAQDPIRPDEGVILPPNGQSSASLPPAENAALAFVDLAKQLELADRYERRASSRRKFAIRDFDALRDLQVNIGEDGAGARKLGAAARSFRRYPVSDRCIVAPIRAAMTSAMPATCAADSACPSTTTPRPADITASAYDRSELSTGPIIETAM
jgi:hypothetical protein